MGHLHNGILLSHKKKENFALCDSMDGEHGNIMLNEISQSEKDKYHMILLVCGIWTNRTNKQTEDGLTDKKQADSRG